MAWRVNIVTILSFCIKFRVLSNQSIARVDRQTVCRLDGNRRLNVIQASRVVRLQNRPIKCIRNVEPGSSSTACLFVSKEILIVCHLACKQTNTDFEKPLLLVWVNNDLANSLLNNRVFNYESLEQRSTIVGHTEQKITNGDLCSRQKRKWNME